MPRFTCYNYFRLIHTPFTGSISFESILQLDQSSRNEVGSLTHTLATHVLFAGLQTHLFHSTSQAGTSNTKAGRQNIKEPDKVKEHGNHVWHKARFAEVSSGCGQVACVWLRLAWANQLSYWLNKVGSGITDMSLSKYIRWDVAQIKSVFITIVLVFLFCSSRFCKQSSRNCTNWVISEGTHNAVNNFGINSLP